MSKKQKDTTPAAQPGARRHTIGYIGSQLTNRNNYTVWQGIIDAAREKDVNVISLFPEDLDTTNGFDAQANVLFDLINPDLLDGLVIWASNLSNYAGSEGAKRIFEYYRSIPIVSIEKGGSEDIPYLEIDSYQSMREAVVHLIKDHGYRRIAFVRGPDATHAGARERYQGYLDVLSEYGIPIDPDLVSPPTDGSWAQEVGEEAIALLVDQRHASFDAVIGVCDHIAIGAMRALDARGIHIPGQVAVVGFDDDTGSNSTIPPLTTMSLRGYEQGRQAAQMLLTLLDGGQIPAQAKVPPHLVIRQSCGCMDPAVTQAAAGSAIVTDKPLEAFKASQREKALSEMKQAAGTAVEGLNPGWADELLAAFFTELKAGKPGAFLSALDEVLRQVIAVEGQVEAWTNVISALRRCTLPYLENSQLLLRAEDLWLQSQVMMGETAQQAQRHQVAQLEAQTQILNEIRAALITTFDMNALMDTLARELPHLGIPSCYLSLYENPKQPTELSRLMLGYDTRRGRLDLEAEKRVFPSPRLTPDGMLPQDRRYSLVTEALYFRDEQLGFVMFESGPREGPIYDTLREEISSALQGALILEQRKQGEEALARERNLLHTLIDNLPDHIYAKDTDGRFTLGNMALARHMGVTKPDELIGKDDFDLYPPDLAAQFHADEQALIQSGQSLLNHEEPTRDSAGLPKWTLTTKVVLRDSQGKNIGLVGIGRDITTLKQAERELRHSNEELERRVEERTAEIARQAYILDVFMDNIPDNIYFKDLDSRITRVNRAHALHFGFSDPSEEIGKSDFDFFQEEQARPRFEQEQEIIRTGQPILNSEESDGIGHWLLTTKMPLRDEKGEIIGTFGISSDITELVKSKQAAEAAVDEADKARALAEIEKEKAEAAKNEAEKAHHDMEIANQTLAAQMWQTAGQALLNEKMRGEQDIHTLANNVINQLCDYLDVQIGALYVMEKDVLKVVGTYAYIRKNLAKEFRLGEGLVGQAALNKLPITVDVPEDYTPIASLSLGKMVPKHILFIPLVYDEQTIGVAEMGKLAEFTPAQVGFLEKAIESVAIAFMTAQARARVNELFSQTRQQAEELQSQEEELRAANEELEAQTESLRASKT